MSLVATPDVCVCVRVKLSDCSGLIHTFNQENRLPMCVNKSIDLVSSKYNLISSRTDFKLLLSA